jgi:hypothetical protein
MKSSYPCTVAHVPMTYVLSEDMQASSTDSNLPRLDLSLSPSIWRRLGKASVALSSTRALIARTLMLGFWSLSARIKG